MAKQVRVWQEGDREFQHFADAPGDDVARRWAGTTACGLAADLIWIPSERVDAGAQCPRCATVTGPSPALEGDHPGPV